LFLSIDFEIAYDPGVFMTGFERFTFKYFLSLLRDHTKSFGVLLWQSVLKTVFITSAWFRCPVSYQVPGEVFF